eukprot:scaffold3072_cov116-Isochrysis_galbana.AAC.13
MRLWRQGAGQSLTGMSNQSCARQAHGPIVTTKAEHSISSPSTTTPQTSSNGSDSDDATPDAPAADGRVRMPWTVPMRRVAPLATAASASLVHNSRGATCAPPSASIILACSKSPSSQSGQRSVRVLADFWPGEMERTGIRRYEVRSSSEASSSCRAKPTWCSWFVTDPSPQSRARKPAWVARWRVSRTGEPRESWQAGHGCTTESARHKR